MRLERWHDLGPDALADRIGVPLVELWSSIGSTNDRARLLLREGAGDYSLVLAEAQRRGRGRGGSTWFSPPGSGLWLSLVMRAVADQERPLLPLRVGLALARAIEQESLEAPQNPGGNSGVTARSALRVGAELLWPVGLKWPNDVWLAGRKIAGVLCEATRAGVVVGIGVNVSQPADVFPEDLRGRATSIAAATGRRPDRLRLLVLLVEHLRRLVESGPTTLDDGLVAEWMRRDVLAGRQVRVGPVSGRAVGITTSGLLRLETPHGPRVVAAGHVDFDIPEAD